MIGVVPSAVAAANHAEEGASDDAGASSVPVPAFLDQLGIYM